MPSEFRAYRGSAARVEPGAGVFRCCVNTSINATSNKCDKCPQCQSMVRDGSRQCRLPACKDFKYCAHHIRQHYGVRIATSGIPNSGMGLWATKDFAAGDNVAPMGHGMGMTERQLDARYNYLDVVPTAPYAFRDGEVYYDSACVRGPGAYSNSIMPRGNQARLNSRIVVLRNGESWLEATKDVRAGQELFNRYGEEYWTGAGLDKLYSHTVTVPSSRAFGGPGAARGAVFRGRGAKKNLTAAMKRRLWPAAAPAAARKQRRKR